jgi:hypothetical protein
MMRCKVGCYGRSASCRCEITCLSCGLLLGHEIRFRSQLVPTNLIETIYMIVVHVQSINLHMYSRVSRPTDHYFKLKKAKRFPI